MSSETHMLGFCFVLFFYNLPTTVLDGFKRQLRWKGTLAEVGINMNIFKPHSVDTIPTSFTGRPKFCILRSVVAKPHSWNITKCKPSLTLNSPSWHKSCGHFPRWCYWLESLIFGRCVKINVYCAEVLLVISCGTHRSWFGDRVK